MSSSFGSASSKKNNPATKIVLGYLLLASIWILLSDQLLYQVEGPRQFRLFLATLKGWLFVGVTASLLYYLINRYFTKLENSRHTLAASEERLLLALKSSHMGVWEWNVLTDQVLWSPEVYDIVGLREFDGNFASFDRLIHPEDADRVKETVRQAMTARVDYADAFRIIRPENGEVRWLANMGQGKYTTDGTPLSILGTVRDITVQKNSETLMKLYSHRLLDLEEEMRRNLAAELHDEIGRDLTALGLNFAILFGSFTAEMREKQGERIEDIRNSLESTSRTIRGLMSKLRPPVLDDYGLTSALRWHCDKFAKRSGIAVELAIDGRFPRMTADRELALFRIAQEALNNVSKHADARTAVISLRQNGDTISMSIKDDGIGFALQPVFPRREESGWGLVIMRERTEAVDGRFLLESAPGKGTSITVELALET
jgi:PAS domain S-box-containing protein